MDPANDSNELRVPVICLDESAVPAFQVFNPNDWHGQSRAVIQSCATEFSLLRYSTSRISEMCHAPKDRCQRHFENIRRHCVEPTQILPKVVCYAQVPELHLAIEAFFSSIKSFLDLIVQLVSSEEIVGVKVHGFHKDKGVYGGAVLNMLERNATSRKKEIARALRELIAEHKDRWIDQAISARDALIHPTQGAQQVMFQIQLTLYEGHLVYEDAVPPSVDGQSIEEYSRAQLENTKSFAESFLARLRPDAEAG